MTNTRHEVTLDYLIASFSATDVGKSSDLRQALAALNAEDKP